MKRLVISCILSLHALIIPNTRNIIFDICDYSTETTHYAHQAIMVPFYYTPNNDVILAHDLDSNTPITPEQATSFLQAKHASSAQKQIITYTTITDDNTIYTMIFTSLGTLNDHPIAIETYRKAVALALKEAEKHNCSALHLTIPTCVEGTMNRKAEELATISYLALYQYDELLTRKKETPLEKICVHAHVSQPDDFKQISTGLRYGEVVGKAVCTARDWINTPANLLNPTIFAEKIVEYSLPYSAKIETIVFEHDDIKRIGMGGLLGVSQGSDQPCVCIVQKLMSKQPNARTIALVGKGVTFDAGGLNLKTSMIELMKLDMGGAAAILAAMPIFANLNLPVNIIVCTPLTENMINGSATKPGDVHRMYNGATVEIINTDAEGRLILADALAYVIEQYTPDYVIDMATLTGGCLNTFGGVYAAAIGNNIELISHAKDAAERTGELVCSLPIHPTYTARMKSDIADLRNLSKEGNTASAQTAAAFLKEFVGSTKWLHLDIAGTVHPQEYGCGLFSGYGVRLLIELVQSLAQQ